MGVLFLVVAMKGWGVTRRFAFNAYWVALPYMLLPLNLLNFWREICRWCIQRNCICVAKRTLWAPSSAALMCVPPLLACAVSRSTGNGIIWHVWPMLPLWEVPTITGVENRVRVLWVKSVWLRRYFSLQVCTVIPFTFRLWIWTVPYCYISITDSLDKVWFAVYRHFPIGAVLAFMNPWTSILLHSWSSHRGLNVRLPC